MTSAADIPIRGDGHFLWYHAESLEPGSYASPHPTREAAIEAGRSFHTGKAFLVFEADRAAPDLGIFHRQGETIVDRVFALNRHLIDPEIGNEIVIAQDRAYEHLGDMLDYTFARWWDRYRPSIALRFATFRHREEISPAEHQRGAA